MTRYSPSRHYLAAGFIAVGLTVFSGWCASLWTPAAIPAALFLFSSALVFYLASRPAIEIHETHFRVGKRMVPWSDIRRLDRTGWISPLAVYVTLADNSRLLLIYPGDLDSSNSLLRHLRRFSRYALIDGIPYRQFWGDSLQSAAQDRAQLASPKYQVVRPEDEAEIERLFQRLKTVGHLDPKSDEK